MGLKIEKQVDRNMVLKKKNRIPNRMTSKEIWHPLTGLFLRKLQKHGKKHWSFVLLYNIFELVLKLTNTNPNIILEQALFKLRIPIKIKRQKIGGAVYQIPFRINIIQAISLAVEILLQSNHKKKISFKAKTLTFELLDIWNNKGISINKRDHLIKQALSLRVFSNFY
uniref:30S ribosomal protein S7 n=1 Tax=Nephromyces sp. ex Molgula occidentalis TaxID=2544991 RepID=A0A5C1H7V1_9APIC|nr:30S ribosomal protein S7 [Nephromyces sp. ex Molgula occidentalis]